MRIKRQENKLKAREIQVYLFCFREHLSYFNLRGLLIYKLTIKVVEGVGMLDFPSALFVTSFSSSFAFPPPRKLHDRLRDWKSRERWKWRDIALELPDEKLYVRREEKIRLVADYYKSISSCMYMQLSNLFCFWPLFYKNQLGSHEKNPKNQVLLVFLYK